MSKLRPEKPLISNIKDNVLMVAQMLASKRGSASLVIGVNGGLAGIVTDTDVTRRLVARDLNAAPVEQRDSVVPLMRGPILTVRSILLVYPPEKESLIPPSPSSSRLSRSEKSASIRLDRACASESWSIQESIEGISTNLFNESTITR